MTIRPGRALRVPRLVLACLIFAAQAQAAPVERSFGPLFDLEDGPGVLEATLRFRDIVPTSPLAIDLSFAGDLNSIDETFSVFIDDVDMGVLCDFDIRDRFDNSSDVCSQGNDRIQRVLGALTLEETVEVLADGEVVLSFASLSGRVNNLVSFTRPIESSGVTFPETSDFSLAVGGMVTFDADPSTVPLPGALPLLAVSLGGFALAAARRRRTPPGAP